MAEKPARPVIPLWDCMYTPLLMIVDDAQDRGYMTAALAEVWGYRAIVATDPYTAISMAKSEPVDVFVLDIGLPGMDGYDLGAGLARTYPSAAFIGNCLTSIRFSGSDN